MTTTANVSVTGQFGCQSSPVSESADAIRSATLWFEQQIENAKQDQISGFAVGPAVRGERAWARHCALYEAQQVFLKAIGSSRHAQTTKVPWEGNLSVDLRRGSLRVNADGVALIDEDGTCWAVVFPDKNGFYDHASTIVSALSISSPEGNSK